MHPSLELQICIRQYLEAFSPCFAFRLCCCFASAGSDSDIQALDVKLLAVKIGQSERGKSNLLIDGILDVKACLFARNQDRGCCFLCAGRHFAGWKMSCEGDLRSIERRKG